MGIVHDRRLQELRLYTDFGRCSRPLFIVANQELLIKKEDIRKLLMYETDEERLTWKHLIERGYIECVHSGVDTGLAAVCVICCGLRLCCVLCRGCVGLPCCLGLPSIAHGWCCQCVVW